MGLNSRKKNPSRRGRLHFVPYVRRRLHQDLSSVAFPPNEATTEASRCSREKPSNAKAQNQRHHLISDSAPLLTSPSASDTFDYSCPNTHQLGRNTEFVVFYITSKFYILLSPSPFLCAHSSPTTRLPAPSPHPSICLPILNGSKPSSPRALKAQSYSHKKEPNQT